MCVCVDPSLCAARPMTGLRQHTQDETNVLIVLCQPTYLGNWAERSGESVHFLVLVL